MDSLLLRKGFLDVKFPPDSPERVLHKAWRRLWTSVSVLRPLNKRGEPSLVLLISREPQDQQSQHLKASRDGLRLFRCRSGSRPLQTWALSSGTSLIVYLAAEDEEETQSWMHSIREGLWPSIMSQTENTHDVSLIDDDKTFTTGLLGLYGRLTRASDGTVSIIHPHWQGILLRWKQEDVVNTELVRRVGQKTSGGGVFKITLKRLNADIQTFYFYSSSASSAIEWLHSRKVNSEELKDKSALQNTEVVLVQNTEQDNITDSVDSDYATINGITGPPKTEEEIIPNEMSSLEQKVKNINEELLQRSFLSANISSDLLNASLSSAMTAQTLTQENSVLSVKSDVDSDDSASDLYEHVYEDMTPREYRSHTVYEEVQDSECDYVPPLPPPLPSTQKPNMFRLLKLSESVAEALKLAETTPIEDRTLKHKGNDLK